MNTPYTAPQLRALIREVLQSVEFGLWSPEAEELLMATCAQESLLGKYRTQAPHGPARGIFQEEGEDFTDLKINWLRYHSKTAVIFNSFFASVPANVDELVTNDKAAIITCRLHYSRRPEPLPAANDLTGIWNFYKQWYNTPQGAATQDEFTKNYRTLVLGA